MITTDALIKEPATKYDSLRASHLTSHGLMDYLRCPKTHRLKTTGGLPFKSSKSFELGTAAHVLVLEGRAAFKGLYYTIEAGTEPVNEKTGKPYGVGTKAHTEWLNLVAGDRHVLTADDGAMIEAMAASVREHDHAAMLLEQGEPEGVLRTVLNEQAGQPVKAQVRIDWFNPEYGMVDFKTIADLDKFTEQFTEYQYDLQFAFYQMIAEDVLGAVFPFHAIVVEKKAPYRVGVFEVSQTCLEQKRKHIEAYIADYAQSVASDHWPTRYEGVRVIGGTP